MLGFLEYHTSTLSLLEIKFKKHYPDPADAVQGHQGIKLHVLSAVHSHPTHATRASSHRVRAAAAADDDDDDDDDDDCYYDILCVPCYAMQMNADDRQYDGTYT